MSMRRLKVCLLTAAALSFVANGSASAFGGRLLIILGNALATSYLLFFLTDDLRLPDPDLGL